MRNLRNLDVDFLLFKEWLFLDRIHVYVYMSVVSVNLWKAVIG